MNRKNTITFKLCEIQQELRSRKELYRPDAKSPSRNLSTILDRIMPLCDKYGCGILLTDEIVDIMTRYFIRSTATLFDKTAISLDPLSPENSVAAISLVRGSENMDSLESLKAATVVSETARRNALCGLFAIADMPDFITANEEPSKLNKDVLARGSITKSEKSPKTGDSVPNHSQNVPADSGLLNVLKKLLQNPLLTEKERDWARQQIGKPLLNQGHAQFKFLSDIYTHLQKLIGDRQKTVSHGLTFEEMLLADERIHVIEDLTQLGLADNIIQDVWQRIDRCKSLEEIRKIEMKALKPQGIKAGNDTDSIGDEKPPKKI